MKRTDVIAVLASAAFGCGATLVIGAVLTGESVPQYALSPVGSRCGYVYACATYTPRPTPRPTPSPWARPTKPPATAATVAAIPTSTPHAVSRTEYGVQVLGGPDTGEKAALDALRPQWILARVLWKPTIQGWGWSDPVVADAEERGARLLLRWWINDECQRGVSNAQLATFAGEIAARYRGRVAAYQVGNEPDLAGRCGSAAAEATRYNAVRAAIRANDPAAIVVMPGLMFHPPDTAYLRAFLAVATPDAVAVHVYAIGRDPQWGDPTAPLAAVRAVTALPIWVTEAGGETATDLRVALSACRTGGATVCVVYAASDEQSAPWGLWGLDGKPKPGILAAWEGTR